MGESDFSNNYAYTGQPQGSPSETCPICMVILGQTQAWRVYEDNFVSCFLDENPASEGHLLVVPRTHYTYLALMPPSVSKHMFTVARDLSKALKSAMQASETVLLVPDGGAGGQASEHFFFHIIPRGKQDDDLKFGLDLRRNMSSQDLESFRARMSQELTKMLSANPEVLSQVGTYSQPSELYSSVDNQDIGIGNTQLPADEGLSLETPNDTLSMLAKFIYDNPQMKDKIISDPDGFKKDINDDPKLRSMFSKIDLQKLSAYLSSIQKQYSGGL